MLRYLFRTIPPSKWLGAFLLSFSTLTQVCDRFGNNSLGFVGPARD